MGLWLDRGRECDNLHQAIEIQIIHYLCGTDSPVSVALNTPLDRPIDRALRGFFIRFCYPSVTRPPKWRLLVTNKPIYHSELQPILERSNRFCIEKYSEEYGFGEVKLIERISRTDIPKQHAKFFYQVAYPAGGRQDKILLDVLFEEIHYTNVVELPIQSRLLKTEGDPIMVKLPSKEDLLGDKLTAFAPHTTGIPFFKGEKNCSMEICKQLFDIASLFDIVSDLSITAKTFNKFAMVELQYRGESPNAIQKVLDDIYDTAKCIVMRGQESQEEFELIQDGIKKVRGFIHSEVYTLESAITNASKAAYLAKLIDKGINEVKHYNPSEANLLVNVTIQSPLPTKLNKLKKTNAEAFFYWSEIQKLG